MPGNELRISSENGRGNLNLNADAVACAEPEARTVRGQRGRQNAGGEGVHGDDGH
jgi:hypothetical protein